MPPPSTSRISSANLTPPALQAAQVPRTALLERALQAPILRVLLVRAPAGFGKTALLAQLAERLLHAGEAVAWLTLDGADNDPARFVHCLRAATAALVDLPDAVPREQPADEMALKLLDTLAASTETFWLFLDQFEHLVDVSTLGFARALIERLPPMAHVVIGTRTLPELGLGGLRPRGRVVEFDTEALRFLPEESAAFLACRAMLPAQDISALHDKTEGWPAALWLAAAALERHSDQHAFVAGFSGLQTDFASYLADDVLARLAPPLRGFLLRTSILDSLTAPLCDAVLGSKNSAAHLLALEDANLFLGARRDASGQYRYHGLFAEFLRDRLQRDSPGDLPALHGAAAGWYEGQGRPIPAIRHAIQAGNVERTLALLEHHAGGLIAQGRGGLLGHYFDALPADALDGHPLLQVLRAWAALFAHGAGAAGAILAQHSPDPGGNASLKTCLAALESMVLALNDRYYDAWLVGREPLTRLPSGLDFADVSLINTVALALLCLGRKDEARALVDASRGHAGEGRSRFNAAVCEAVSGMVELQEARLREATARLRLAARIGDPDRSAVLPGCSFLAVPLAEALYEAGEVEAARQILHVTLPLVRNSSVPDHLISAHLLHARVEFSEGEVDKAFDTLNQLEILGHERRLPRVVANARLERSRVYLLQHHLAAARIELARCRVDDVWEREATDTATAQDTEYLAIGEFRLAIAEQRAAQVLPAIEAELARALAAGRPRRSMKLRLLRALAAFQCERIAQAHADLAELMPVTAAEGFVRLFLDEGPAVAALCRSFESAPAMRGASPVLAEHVHRLASSVEAEPESGGTAAAQAQASSPGADQAPVEALTSRELRLLNAVAMGYSNRAIADKFFISPHTVRGHLRSVNAKLHVASRTQAVAVARRLGLLY